MTDMSQNAPFSMLPYRRPPWREFLLIMAVQGIGPGYGRQASPAADLHSLNTTV